ncbi:MFS transporter [Thermomonospora amylolytica]|uniref:MFS transporter n=1 Tax=Thermomonospora amylolytica TaxID=1411117 RepID=UPI001F3A00B5|nr:MFS transporter [Thermomonospora amylolytica]
MTRIAERGPITHWAPDDPAFWRTRGRRIAWRNLACSVCVEHLAFTVWTLWSVVVVHLGHRNLTVDQLFWLVALPSLVGAFVRVPYTVAPAVFGTRTWTVASALLLVVPALGLAAAAGHPGTPYWVLLLVAATAGLGGGNFASGVATITHFFPQRRQGLALGLNAAGGNIGVSTVQLAVPVVIAAFGVAAAGLVWVPLILLAALAAHQWMDDLTVARAPIGDRLRVAARPRTWLLSLLYVGSFGSFLGYATALPLLVEIWHPDAGAARFAFLGGLVGSLARPVGGWLADRLGGAQVTTGTFLAMTGAVAVTVAALRAHDLGWTVAAFVLLFVTTGLGNGAAYRMIPAVFAERRGDAAAAAGLVAAVGALGGFLINTAFGRSIAATGSAETALWIFACCYLGCAALTWAWQLRNRAGRPAPQPVRPQVGQLAGR